MEFNIFNRKFEFLTEERQWVKLSDFLHMYLFDKYWAKVGVLIIAAVFLLMILSVPIRGRVKKTINIFLFAGYTAALILLFVVSRDYGIQGVQLFSWDEYLTGDGYHETKVLILLIDALMFVPFGFLLRKASGRGYAVVNFFIIMIMSLGIEVAQYVFLRGYTSLIAVAAYICGAFTGVILMLPFGLFEE